MICLFVSLLFTITIGWWLFKRGKSAEWDCEDLWYIGSIVTWIIGGLVSFGFLFGIGYNWYCHLLDVETLPQYDKQISIYEDQRDVLTQEFKGYLAESYPQYEKSIFESIKPDNLNICFIKYPELRSSDTIMLLANKIYELNKLIYDVNISREDTLKMIRVRQRNWIDGFPPILPKPHPGGE